MCRLFNLRPQFELIASDVNFDKPIFHYHYRCTLYRNGEAVGQGEGNCNSYEKKYRWRKAELTCPGCGSVGTLIKGRREYGGVWFCYGKKVVVGLSLRIMIPKLKIKTQVR